MLKRLTRKCCTGKWFQLKILVAALHRYRSIPEVNLLFWIIYYLCVSGNSLVWASTAQEGREEQEDFLPRDLVDHEYLLQAGSERHPRASGGCLRAPAVPRGPHQRWGSAGSRAVHALLRQPGLFSLTGVRAGPRGTVGPWQGCIWSPPRAHTSTHAQGHILSWVLLEEITLCVCWEWQQKYQSPKTRGGRDAGEIRRGDASENCSAGNAQAVLCTLLKLWRLN